MIGNKLLLILAIFVLAACDATETQAPPPAMTPLPTAVPPESLPGTWAVPFGLGLRAGFWDEGVHRYSLSVDCPATGQDLEGGWNSFEVTEAVPVQPNPIFLRVGGLSAGPLFPIGIRAVHPAQETVAYVTLLGLDEEAVEEAVAGCEIFMFFDEDDTPFQLLPLEPYQG